MWVKGSRWDHHSRAARATIVGCRRSIYSDGNTMTRGEWRALGKGVGENEREGEVVVAGII